MDEVRRRRYLAAMGIVVWERRSADLDRAAVPVAAETASQPAPEPVSESAPEPAPQPAQHAAQSSAPAATREPAVEAPVAQEPITEISVTEEPIADEGPVQAAEAQPQPQPDGPPAWSDADLAGLPANGAGAMPPPQFDHAPPEPSRAAQIGTMDWAALEQAVAGCHACGLCERRNRTVFGVGDRDADIMFVGEGPGADEDRRGEPFVGRAGQLLDRMLAAAGLHRSRVYIANIVKCRPPGNRDPHGDEAGACRAYLQRQIELVRPRLMVCLGRVPASNLLNTAESVGRLRGRFHRYGAAGVPLLVTYHPSYYLRSPEQKAKGWQDLQRMLEFLAQDAAGDARV